jgi:hypothetical protein
MLTTGFSSFKAQYCRANARVNTHLLQLHVDGSWPTFDAISLIGAFGSHKISDPSPKIADTRICAIRSSATDKNIGR